MPKLTALEVRNMKDPCRRGDGQGFFYEIPNTGIKRWIYRYKINGKAKKHTIGRYPGLSLEKARKKHIAARELVPKGMSPSEARKSEKNNR